MSAQLAEDEFPARTVLKTAQERLAAALAAAEASADALARGKEHLGVLERLRNEALAEIVGEARSLAETFAESGVCAMIGGAAQRDREIKDELGAFEIAFGILVQKNSDAQRAVPAASAAVIEEETTPLLARMKDFESAAGLLRSQLRSLQHCGQFGLAPVSLPDRLRAEPANVFHADRPLNFHQQKAFDRWKSRWRSFADALRDDADATLSLGD